MILKAYVIAAYFFLIGYHVRIQRERLGKKISCVYVHLGMYPRIEPVTIALHQRAIDVLCLHDSHFTKILPAIRNAHLEVDAA